MPTRLLKFRSLFKVAIVFLAFISAISVQAQVTTGTVRGEVTDQAGAVVPGATITITDPKTKTSQTAETGNTGEYQFNNLPVGTYVITVQPPANSNFSTLTLNDVRVKLNEITDVPTVLQPGETTASVTVSAGGAELVDSTSLNLAKDFNARQEVSRQPTWQL
jgi:hypothetical protein